MSRFNYMYKMNRTNAKRKRMEEEEEEEGDDMDIPFSHLLKHLKTDVYMIDNHLYFFWMFFCNFEKKSCIICIILIFTKKY